MVNPVHIKGLLVARTKEGYRAKKFGTNTHDSDKISIQLTLPIEYGTVVHYELQYRALNARTRLVGVAHVKVEISGNLKFVQKMKDEFLTYTSGRNSDATRLVKVVWWLRREDLLQSFLCPVAWGSKTLSATPPSIRRLGSFSRLQRMRNFRIDRFDVICTGRIPYAHQEEVPWSDIINTDSGEQALFEALSAWSTQIVEEKSKYVKHVPASDNLIAYCIVDVAQSPMASRLFGITVSTIGGCAIQYRLMIVAELKDTFRKLRDVTVLAKRMYGSLVGVPLSLRKPSHHAWRVHFLENHFEHEEWRPVKDPELMDLLMRRRREIGKFFLLHSTATYAVFAKDISVETGKVTANPSDDVHLVIYQIELRGDDRQPIVKMHVEKEVGRFATDGVMEYMTRAHKLCMRVKRFDQECSVALRSRTNLLGLFPDVGLASPPEQRLKEDVGRLLAYSYRHSRELRFFGNFPAANKELERLTVDLISDQLAGDIVKLNIDPSLMIGSQNAGHWFFIRFDRHTLSFVHLPLIEKTKEESDLPYAYRELTFFTFGISDLYCSRDEGVVDDDESSQGHISEYMPVEEFADVLDTAHKANYAEAAYLALRSPESQADMFTQCDFDLVLGVCAFEKVAEVLVTPESFSGDAGSGRSKLMKTIGSLLSPVPGHDTLMFYTAETVVSALASNEGDPAAGNYDGDASFDDDLSSDDSEAMGAGKNSSRAWIGAPLQSKAVPPVFVRFSVDGEIVQHSKLESIRHSANLAVQMSVFKTTGKESEAKHALPQLHTAVSVEIENALKSYNAEQTLERMRTNVRSIAEVDLWTVRRCMRKARDVKVSFIVVHFYVAKSDKMVAASNQASSESEIEAGFKLLLEELQASPDFLLHPTSNDSFCVVDIAKEGSSLKYWGFIAIQRSLGLVTVEVYHPDGLTEALSILNSLQAFVSRICHRTNQLLLLRKLHRTRNASSYLIPGSGHDGSGDETFRDGHFSCPVKFEECYEFYHRCSAPKVIASLISTTLHSFAVSNRGLHFVYKDEAMSVFYLTLHASENQSPEHVKLLVYGVQEPGASVTIQLTRLLRKKILLLAVEAWSLVLNKNPHFSWKSADLEFVQNFQAEWFKEEEAKQDLPGRREFFIDLPQSVYDPLSILMFFRQNICGSTFFHRLNGVISDDTDFSNEIEITVDGLEEGAEITFDRNEFTFFYNNAPSPLDQNFQALSTLTSKGKRFSERTGTGIAIIQVSLVRKDDLSEIDAFKIGSPPGRSVSRLATPLEMLVVKEAKVPIPLRKSGSEGDPNNFLVRLRLIDTALDVEALKEWLILTLNQVVAAWLIERHIQRSRTGLLSPCLRQEEPPGPNNIVDVARERRLREIDKLCPGLPELIDVLRSSAELPHPAVKTLEFNTVMMASSVASHTVGLLRDCILKNLSSGKATDPSIISLATNTVVIRSSRGDKSQVVTLVPKRDSLSPSVSLELGMSDRKAISDSPIDCPEYVCYFCWESYSDANKERSRDEVPMVFPEVIIGDVVRDRRPSLFSQRLIELKQRFPSTFLRSFAFILSVKRNRQTLTMYNWDPKLVSKVLSSVKELDAASVSETGVKLRSTQRRCLGDLAPFVRHASTVHTTSPRTGKGDPTDKSTNPTSPAPVKHMMDPTGNSGPQRRIQRPTSIRRPKLVGKSVEGGAMQAMAASRAKARANTKAPTRSSHAENPQHDMTVPPVVAPIMGFKGSHEEEVESDRFRRKFEKSMGPPWGPRFTMTRSSFETLQEYWFRSAQTIIGKSTRDAVLLQTKPVWNEIASVLPVARTLSKDLSSEMTFEIQTMMESVGACRVVPTSPNSPGDSDRSVFLMTALRKSPMTTFLVFRISTCRARGKGMKLTMQCDVWIMKLLAANFAKVAMKRRSTRSVEKRAGALGKTCGIAHQFKTRLEARLFDYSAGLVKHAALRNKSGVLDEEYLQLTESMVQKYTFDVQQEMPELRYKTFDATIILTSYEDSMIDKFDGLSLFKHCYDLDSGTGLKCGPDAILCVQTIDVYETKTLCFLKRLRSDKARMGLVFLCQTEGRDLDNVVFPEGSNVAATIFKLIVIEGARLAYDMLRASAIQKHRDSLWKKACARNNRCPTPEFEELLSMVTSRSFFDDDYVKSTFWEEHLAIDPEDLFVKMSRDPGFTPNRKFRIHADGYHMVFFNSKLDAFIMFNYIKGQVVDVHLMRRLEITDEDVALVIETFTQYILFYLWKA